MPPVEFAVGMAKSHELLLGVSVVPNNKSFAISASP